jgi:L-lysine 2,3-aminomutase
MKRLASWRLKMARMKSISEAMEDIEAITTEYLAGRINIENWRAEIKRQLYAVAGQEVN